LRLVGAGIEEFGNDARDESNNDGQKNTHGCLLLWRSYNPKVRKRFTNTLMP
jgi:hypothetical protein